jgi:pimeloyl-ACP methyl ester carboxylesterase
VVLVHGFGVPAATLRPLRGWLSAAGWDVISPSLGLNLACASVATEQVVAAAADGRARTGQPVALVGHSRGGLLGKVAAVRRPDLVGVLVTVCTPWTLGPPDRPGVATVGRALRFGRRHGVDLLGSIDCADGACCSDLRPDLAQVPVAPWTALWSSADRIAGDDARCTGATRTVDLGTSHLGAVLSVEGWRAIGEALQQR